MTGISRRSIVFGRSKRHETEEGHSRMQQDGNSHSIRGDSPIDTVLSIERNVSVSPSRQLSLEDDEDGVNPEFDTDIPGPSTSNDVSRKSIPKRKVATSWNMDESMAFYEDLKEMFFKLVVLLLSTICVGVGAMPMSIPETRVNVRMGNQQLRVALRSIIAFNNTKIYTTSQLPDGRMIAPIMAIADMDEQSPSQTQPGLYLAPSVRGHLIYNLMKHEYEVQWESTYNYSSNLNFKGRGMELSDLKAFNGKLYSPDDKTGVIFRLTTDIAIPWIIQADGDGFDNMTFKTEWMTVKDDELYVGGYGKEYTDRQGNFWHNKPMWIKRIDRFGQVKAIDWNNQFKAIRASIGIHFPAYMIHESCQWSDTHQKWFFLPRRASLEAYNTDTDSFKGTNYLLMADEDLQHFDYVRVGTLHPTRGFSAFQFVPGTGDTVIIAIKSEEVKGWPLASYIMVFNIDGTVYMDETKIPGDFKLEGLEFFNYQNIETR